MLDPQYLWLFGLLIGLGSFAQGFTGIGFGIIVLAGIAFTPWNFERATVVLNLLLLVLVLDPLGSMLHPIFENEDDDKDEKLSTGHFRHSPFMSLHSNCPAGATFPEQSLVQSLVPIY